MCKAKRDYYSVLGVSRDTDADGIKKAYRAAAIKYHPDRNPDDKAAEERFKEASEAYDVLSTPAKRATYDRFGPAGLERGFQPPRTDRVEDLLGRYGFGGFGPSSIDDILAGFGFDRSHRSPYGDPIHLHDLHKVRAKPEPDVKRMNAAKLLSFLSDSLTDSRTADRSVQAAEKRLLSLIQKNNDGLTVEQLLSLLSAYDLNDKPTNPFFAAVSAIVADRMSLSQAIDCVACGWPLMPEDRTRVVNDLTESLDRIASGEPLDDDIFSTDNLRIIIV
ncbi:DnaJ domain-containing protein, partial [Candidatus Micrarchaeota archaeon]|nr:DnaJ domain-containing protein [Candidatus Micrarchaeota archaeon]